MLIGLIAASIVPALLTAFIALPQDPEVDRATEALAFLGATFLLALPFSALAVLIIGVPALLLCRRFSLVTWWLAMGVGLLAGVLVAAVRPANQPVIDNIAKYMLLGAVAGLTFWAVWKHGTTGDNS